MCENNRYNYYATQYRIYSDILLDVFVILQRVIEVCKEHLPSMASCLSDPKVTVFVGDGIKYMKEHKGEFDVIITDAPDPIGQYPTLPCVK